MTKLKAILSVQSILPQNRVYRTASGYAASSAATSPLSSQLNKHRARLLCCRNIVRRVADLRLSFSTAPHLAAGATLRDASTLPPLLRQASSYCVPVVRSQLKCKTQDWIELFILNEKILSPDSEISRKCQFFVVFLQFSTNFDIFTHIC